MHEFANRRWRAASAWYRFGRAKSFERTSRRLQLPMALLAAFYIPVGVSDLELIGIAAPAVAPSAEPWIAGFDAGVRVVFAAEFGLLLFLAPRRLGFVRGHLLELAAIVLPAVRLLRILRAVAIAIRALLAVRSVATRTLSTTAIVLGVVIAVAAMFAFAWESGQPGAQIQTFPDALWWALVTATTVGYGDYTPVTAAGRLLAGVLMVSGIAAMTAFTAAIAAALVDRGRSADS